MFAARDRTLAAVQGTEEVVLWFERDLYDQLQLIQILDRLGAPRASLIDLGEPRRIGGLNVLALYERRVVVAGAARELGREAWRAFTSRRPDRRRAPRRCGYRRPAVPRSCPPAPPGRIPFHPRWALTHRAAVARFGRARRRSPSELFERTTAPDERPYLGDAPFLLYVGRLRDGRVPLLTERDGAFELTEAGRAVLAGEDDHVRLNGLDRWLGGVHLHGEEAAWRWDGSRGRLRRAGEE